VIGDDARLIAIISDAAQRALRQVARIRGTQFDPFRRHGDHLRPQVDIVKASGLRTTSQPVDPQHPVCRISGGI